MIYDEIYALQLMGVCAPQLISRATRTLATVMLLVTQAFLMQRKISIFHSERTIDELTDLPDGLVTYRRRIAARQCHARHR